MCELSALFQFLGVSRSVFRKDLASSSEHLLQEVKQFGGDLDAQSIVLPDANSDEAVDHSGNILSTNIQEHCWN